MYSTALNRCQLVKLSQLKYSRALILPHKSVRNHSNLSNLPASAQPDSKFVVNIGFKTKQISNFESKLLQVNGYQEQRASSTASSQKQQNLVNTKKSEDFIERQDSKLSNAKKPKHVYPCHTSGVAFLISKHPLKQRMNQPKWSVLICKVNNVYGINTYESKLRHTRVACPIKLNLPEYASGKNLNITQRQKHTTFSATTQVVNKPNSLLKDYSRSGKGSKRAATQRPKETRSNTISTVNKLDNKPSERVECEARSVPQKTMEINKIERCNYKNKRTKMMHKNNKKTKEFNEKEDLKNLLGDILENGGSTSPAIYVKEKILKCSPLYKLVTNSIERRLKLHDRAFDKQLENPRMFRHPLANSWPPTGIDRRSIFAGSAQFTDNKVKHTINRKLFLLNETNEKAN